MRGSLSTSTTVLRELPDGTEIEIDVDVQLSAGEKQWFNAKEGVGHPGSGPEAEILQATHDGKKIELTADEEERVIDEVESRADEIAADADADYGDYLYDCWKDDQMERGCK